MPSWPGGACPACGSYMPPRQIHCRECLALLDPDLESDPRHAQWQRTYRRVGESAQPEFMPLQEISSAAVLLTGGYYFPCPGCGHDLKARTEHIGKSIACKACGHRFEFQPEDERIQLTGVFGHCPYCSARLRVAATHFGRRLNCTACEGELEVPG